MRRTSRLRVRDREQYNLRINVWDGVLKGASSQIVNPFLGINAIRLGAPNIDLGIISSIPYLAGGFAALASPWLVGQKNLLKMTVSILALARLSVVLLALIDWWDPRRHAALIFVLAIILLNVPGTLATLSWQAMTTAIFSHRTRSAAVMWRQWGMTIAGVLAVLGGGWAVAGDLGVKGYIWLYVAGAVLGLAEVFVYRLFRPGHHPINLPMAKWRQVLPVLWRQQEFRRFILASVVFYYGWLMLWPASLRYTVSVAHATNGWMAVYTASNALMTIMALPLWRWGVQRYSSAALLPWVCVAMAVTPVVYLLHPSLWGLVLANVSGGLSGAGFNLLMNIRLMEVVPPDLRIMAVGANTVATGIVGALGAFSAVAGMRWATLGWVFVASAGIRVAGGWMFSWGQWSQPVQMSAESAAD